MTTTSEPPNGRLSQSLMCLSPDSLAHRGQGGRQLEFSYFFLIRWQVLVTLHFPSLKNLPCTRRGKGGGFDDPNSSPFFSSIMTIQLGKPMVFILECVDAVATRNTSESLEESNDLIVMKNILTEKLTEYVFVILQHRSPVVMGFPMLRPRFYVVGVYKNKVTEETLKAELVAAGNTIHQAITPTCDFFTFLGLEIQNLGLTTSIQ